MSKTILNATIPGLPPTINHYYYHRAGPAFKKPEAQRWLYDTSLEFALRYAKKEPYTKPVELFITFMTSDKRRWDIDNRVKILQDALMYSDVIKDDSQILSLHVKRIFGTQTQTFIKLQEYK